MVLLLVNIPENRVAHRRNKCCIISVTYLMHYFHTWIYKKNNLKAKNSLVCSFSYLTVVMLHNLQLKEFLLFLCHQSSIPASCLWVIQVILGAEVISYKQEGMWKVRKHKVITPFKKHPASHEFTFSSPTPQLGYFDFTYKIKVLALFHFKKKNSHFYTESAQGFGGTDSKVPNKGQESPPVANAPSLPTGGFAALSSLGVQCVVVLKQAAG